MLPRIIWLPQLRSVHRVRRFSPALFGAGSRFYFPSTGAAPVNVAFDAAWEDTSSTPADRRATVTTKIASAAATLSFTDVDASDRDVLIRQWVSAPLDALTIPAQTIKFQMRANETTDTQDQFLTWVVKVVSEDGLTERGQVVAIRRDGTELATSLTNRSDSVTGSSVAVSNRDRLVFEIGVGGDPLVSHSSSISVGDDSGTDLPENDSETSAFNSWLEFSQTVFSFQAEASGTVPLRTLMGVGV